MSAAIIIQLIAQYGIPLASQIFGIVTKHFESNAAPTQEMWDELLKLENDSSEAFNNALKTDPQPTT